MESGPSARCVCLSFGSCFKLPVVETVGGRVVSEIVSGE